MFSNYSDKLCMSCNFRFLDKIRRVVEVSAITKCNHLLQRMDIYADYDGCQLDSDYKKHIQRRIGVHILQYIASFIEIVSIAINMTSVIILAMKLRNISVSESNYEKLRNLGCAGQSFNDVISELIAQSVKKQRSEQRPGNHTQTVHLPTQ